MHLVFETIRVGNCFTPLGTWTVVITVIMLSVYRSKAYSDDNTLTRVSLMTIRFVLTHFLLPTNQVFGQRRVSTPTVYFVMPSNNCLDCWLPSIGSLDFCFRHNLSILAFFRKWHFIVRNHHSVQSELLVIGEACKAGVRMQLLLLLSTFFIKPLKSIY